MKLFIQRPGQSDWWEVQMFDYSTKKNIENGISDSATITIPNNIARTADLTWITSDNGITEFIGNISSIEHTHESKLICDCLSAEAELDLRHIPPISYCGGGGLNLSDILSSDSPVQSPGNAQYLMGMLWLASSLISPGLITWDVATGIGSIIEIGSLVGLSGSTFLIAESYDNLITEDGIYLVTGSYSARDVFIDGKILSKVDSTSDLSSWEYAIDNNILYVIGAGPGDIYGLVAIDGFADNHIRLGDIETDATLDGELAPNYETVMDVATDIVEETGQYIYFRNVGTYTYLDVRSTPPSRGTQASPLVTLQETDIIIDDIKYPNIAPISALIGIGAQGERAEGIRYVVGDSTPKGTAWVEDTFTLSDARLAPWGNLAGTIEKLYVDRSQPIGITGQLLFDGIVVGDWVKIIINNMPYTVQCTALSKSQNSLPKATFGYQDDSISTAFFDRESTEAIKKYRDRIVGEYSSSGDLTVGWMNQTWFPTGMCYDSDTERLLVLANIYLTLHAFNVDDLSYVGEADSWDRTESDFWLFDLDIFNDTIFIKGGNEDDWWFDDAGVCVMGSYLYVAQNNYIRKYDSGMSEVDSFCTDLALDSEITSSCGLGTDGTYLYLSEHHWWHDGEDWQETTRLSKFDSNINSRLNNITPGISGAVECQDSCVYLTDRYGEIGDRKYNSSLVLQATAGFSSIRGICSDGTYLYGICDQDDKIEGVGAGWLLQKFDGDFTVVDTSEFWLEDLMWWTSFEMKFTPDDFEGDPGLILFSLSYSDEEVTEYPDAVADYFVTVNDDEVATLYNMPWGQDILVELDISSGCKLDGTEETINVYSRWSYETLTETKEYTGTVRGITKQ